MSDKFVSDEIICTIDFLTKQPNKLDFVGDLVTIDVKTAKDAILIAKLIRFVNPNCNKLRFDLPKSHGQLKMTIRRIK